MEKKSRKGIVRLLDATRYSIKGISAAWRNEAAFRQEVVVITPLLPLAFWIGTSAVQRALLILSALLILIVELINSAIESAVDRIGPEQHPLSGQAKDMGSAALLLSLIAGICVWISIIWERWGG